MSVNVYRELCYRWNCPCGQENRLWPLNVFVSRQNKLQCPVCLSEHTIAKVINDNGAVMQVERCDDA